MSPETKTQADHRPAQNTPGRTLLLVCLWSGLTACVDPTRGNSNLITDVLILGRSQRPSDCVGDGQGRPPARDCSAEEKEALFFSEIGRPITASVLGLGGCTQAIVDFGDGTPPVTASTNAPPGGTGRFTADVPHTYVGWPGKKLLRVVGDSNCLGDISKDVTVGIGPTGREDFKLGFCVGPRCTAPPTTVCTVVGTTAGPMPPIRRGTGVRIQTNGHTINYGSNQVYDASGDATAPVPAGYQFPNRRKFSMVYRIGTTDYQGEAGPVTFIADQTAPLEICTNDNPGLLSDNDGEMLLTITVNERSAQ